MNKIKALLKSNFTAYTVAALLLLTAIAIPFRTPAQSSSFSLFQTVNGYTLATSNPSTLHFVQGSVTLSGGAGTITFAGNAIFQSTTSYQCYGTDQTAAAAVKIVPASASTATVAGTTTDVVAFVCLGN